ncbi:odorant receptor 10-like [Euwallacea similis]|uniref:odorant receptor 10-like n=1 Tax=Euwallacea similis TaxID=1736056 RepID=UPI00345024AF
MRFVKITMLLLGIWPVKRNGDLTENLYESYFFVTFSYYLLFITSGLMLAFSTWGENYLTTAASMGIVIEYLSNAYKVHLFKSKAFKCLIEEIQESEARIFESKDKKFIKIHLNNAAYSKKIVLFYTIMGTIGISLYFISPLVSNVLTPIGYNNETGFQKHYFIVSSWFPFNPDKYYWAAYLIQFLGCLIGYSYIVHCGAFYINILNFVRTRLQILQIVLANLSEYSRRCKFNYQLSEEQSYFVLLREIVQEHHKVIRFVKRLNDIISFFTLLNFVTSSFQLSLVAYQMFKLSVLFQVTVFSYFITLSTQLFLTYHAAHMIIVESTNIATSIFVGKWDTYPSGTLRILQMICMRAQKPLKMTIGPIAEVKITALFQIFKALYSYICIIMKM